MGSVIRAIEVRLFGLEMARITFVLSCLVVATVLVSVDAGCDFYDSCGACVADSGCGWCSNDPMGQGTGVLSSKAGNSAKAVKNGVKAAGKAEGRAAKAMEKDAGKAAKDMKKGAKAPPRLLRLPKPPPRL